LTDRTTHENDDDVVSGLLGRAPDADFVVVVRNVDGRPMVIRNEPFLRNGSPMPTRYWLVDPELRAFVSQLESQGGVKLAESSVDPTALTAAHAAYAAERDALIPPDWSRPRPRGGVGGTERGIKCLHAHVAWWLAGGNDPVGDWVSVRIPSLREHRVHPQSSS
jgi:hypothetical protein